MKLSSEQKYNSRCKYQIRDGVEYFESFGSSYLEAQDSVKVLCDINSKGLEWKAEIVQNISTGCQCMILDKPNIDSNDKIPQTTMTESSEHPIV